MLFMNTTCLLVAQKWHLDFIAQRCLNIIVMILATWQYVLYF